MDGVVYAQRYSANLVYIFEIVSDPNEPNKVGTKYCIVRCQYLYIATTAWVRLVKNGVYGQ